MRHLQTFPLFESVQKLTREQVQFLDRYTDGTWSVNPSTGLVDVEGDFDCEGENLKDLKGVKLGQVSGNFNCSDNSLKTLKGAPETVELDFYCDLNHLESLDGGPKVVGGDFRCTNNHRLWTLKGAPETVGGDFNCFNGHSLLSLADAPKTIGGEFFSNHLRVPRGQWSLSNLVQIYLRSEGEEKDFLGTLVLSSPESIQKAIDQNPEKMAVELKGILKGLIKKPGYQNLKFPERLQQEVDLLGDLSGVDL